MDSRDGRSDIGDLKISDWRLEIGDFEIEIGDWILDNRAGRSEFGDKGLEI